MNFNSSVGLELVQRAAFLTLYEHLNDAISFVEGNWAHSDQELFLRTNQPIERVTIEPIQGPCFYEGHRPSLIQAPVDQYPNVSVWAVRASPHGESESADHVDVWANLLYVEIMTKSLSDEGEVNRRTVRTAEAAQLVMSNNPTLGGVVSGIDGDTSTSMSDVFVRRENTSYGQVWFWQGVRLEYLVRKDAVLPSSQSGPNFRSLPDGMTAAEMALIDQK